MKRLLGLLSLGFLALAGCQSDMPSMPMAQPMHAQQSLEGDWNYVSTDGEDLSDYGISYSFHNNEWTYTLGEAGTKHYSYTTNADRLTATLEEDNVHSSDPIGSTIASQFFVSGDTLRMQTDGHVAILTRQ